MIHNIFKKKHDLNQQPTNIRVSYGFLMVFLRFSYSFPMVWGTSFKRFIRRRLSTTRQVERVADALQSLTVALEEAKVIASSDARSQRSHQNGEVIRKIVDIYIYIHIYTLYVIYYILYIIFYILFIIIYIIY